MADQQPFSLNIILTLLYIIRSRTQMAEIACEKHAKFYTVLDKSNPVGKPAKYSEDKPWQV